MIVYVRTYQSRVRSARRSERVRWGLRRGGLELVSLGRGVVPLFGSFDREVGSGGGTGNGTGESPVVAGWVGVA